MTRRRKAPLAPARNAWTIPRATLSGMALGIAALLLSAFAESRTMLLLYAGLLLLTIMCGVSILLILLRDVHARQRGDRVRPIRIFDLTIGALLVLPAGYGAYRVAALLGL